MKRPPDIYIKLKEEYLNSMTLRRASESFGPVVVSISAFAAPLANLAANAHEVNQKSILLQEYHEKELIPSIERLVINEKATKKDIIQRNINEGKIFQRTSVEEMIEKLRIEMTYDFEKKMATQRSDHNQSIDILTYDFESKMATQRSDHDILRSDHDILSNKLEGENQIFTILS